MDIGATRKLARLCAVAVAVLLALIPSLAHAQSEHSGLSYESGAPCYTLVAPAESVSTVARDRSRWVCEEFAELPSGAQQIALRFDVEGTGITHPAVLVNSHTYGEIDTFSRLEVFTVGESLIAGSGWLSLDDTAPTSPVWKTRFAAPELAEPTVAMIALVDAPSSAAVASRFELDDAAPNAPIANTHQLIAALLCGLILTPALIGIGYYRALRARFTLYHILFCVLAAIQVAALGGLLPLVASLSRSAQFVVLHFSFDLMTATSAVFAASFIERDKLGQKTRRLFYWLAGLALALGVIRVLFAPVVGIAVAYVYYAGYALFLAGLALAMAPVLRAGSRAGWFLLAGYLPLLIIGLLRVVLGLASDFDIRFHAITLQHFSLSWQVVVSAFAVADRFAIIRQERDNARSEAEVLERVSERDSLTGLYNRRIITERYEQLQSEGFTSLALLDLDHFKKINDTFGHATGDKVLQAVGKVLEPDKDTIAVRMGGEEFALLLRGTRAFERAEERRAELEVAASAALQNAQRVTASMGLVELPPGAASRVDFDALYERADKLLYEAKSNGRDRAVSERLKVFQPRRRDRRSSDRRAAA